MASHGSTSKRSGLTGTVIPFHHGTAARMSAGGSLDRETLQFPGMLVNV